MDQSGSSSATLHTPAAVQTSAPPTRQRLSLPERPRLAPGVRLVGQMQESAFEDPPWLLERDGAGYIQVTQLLFQIASECQGNCSVDEIAERVSQRSGRGVSPDNVRQLIARQLVPRGLIEIPGLTQTMASDGARSPLALNMRVRMIGPRAITPLTRVLRILYWPPVLMTVLVVAALAEGWVYLVHGVGGGVHDAIYTPSLMLVVLAAIVLSAAFHELGHATALHYGGGRIKGMGAGLYIVYPAFFTDVSDNYRLSRWGRVRTDLGGFYFNLIFALALLGLYLLTRQEVLLMIVVLINLEIIHQLLPFLRLDGYWTLADLTGVPDFFSQMTAFVRSVSPIKGVSEGRKLPALKPWAKVIFGLYMAITIPLLGLLLLLMVKSLPRVLATVWDSAGQQTQALGQSAARGDVLGVLGAAGQIVLLALPTVGLCYTLYSLGRRMLVGLWTWSKPTPARRVAGGLAAMAALLLVGWLWAPQVPFGRGQPGPMYDQVQFQPIAANERGTVLDGVAGVVATTEPAATDVATGTAVPSTTPVGTAVPGAIGTPAPTSAPLQATTAPIATTQSTAVVQLTPAATARPTTAARTPGSTATARVPAATAVATPTP